MSLFQSGTQDEEVACGRRVTFKVYGQPISKGSARAFALPGKDGGKPRAILVQAGDRNLRDWESLIRTAAQQHAGPGKTYFAKGTPVAVQFWFYFTRPKSKKHFVPCVVKPDWDKVSRAVCDAMEKVLFDDDCQITTATVRKRYTAGAPHVAIVLEQDWKACDEAPFSEDADICHCRLNPCVCKEHRP